MSINLTEHVDYPHHPGQLYDCPACERGECMCTDSSGPCVSVYCAHPESESERQ